MRHVQGPPQPGPQQVQGHPQPELGQLQVARPVQVPRQGRGPQHDPAVAVSAGAWF